MTLPPSYGQPRPPKTPPFTAIEVAVREVPGEGWFPFVLLVGEDGAVEALTRFGKMPCMQTRELATDLAIVLAWDLLDAYETSNGQPISAIS